MKLQITEAHVAHHDDGRSYRLGEDVCNDTWIETSGELYRLSLREHGRCIGRVYVDRNVPNPNGEGTVQVTDAIGWVFQKRRPYEDAPRKTYLHETWITFKRIEG